MFNYLMLFLASFSISLILTPIIRKIAVRFNYVSFPKDDRWHKRPTAILGGVAIFIASIAPLIYFLRFSNREIVGFFVAASIIFICGIVDDFRKIAPQLKLLLQIIASCIVIYFGITIRFGSPYFSALPQGVQQIIDLLIIPFTIIWIVGITNAFNLMDNMDGLSSGIAGIVAVMLFFSGIFIGNVIIPVIAVCFAGACFGFLPYNFNPAKIFMGDSGSMFLGFSLSLIALMGTSARTFSNILVTLAVPVLILAVPIFDTMFVTFKRRAGGRSIMKGGKDHTSHRLVSLGLTEKKTVVFLYLVSILFGIIALAYSKLDFLIVSIMAILTLIVLFFFGMFLAEVKTYSKDSEIAAARRKKISQGKVVLNTFIFNKTKLIEVLIDFTLICIAYFSAYLLRFEGEIIGHNLYLLKISLPWIIVIKLVCFYYFDLYRGIWHYVGITNLISIFKAVTAGSVLSVLFITFVHRFQDHSRVVFIIDWLLMIFFLSFSRIIFRLLQEYFYKFQEGKRILIFGAGSCGELFLREAKHNKDLSCRPVGFIDDDKSKKGKIIHGLKILGSRKDIQRIIEEKGIEELVITIPSLSKEQCVDILEVCGEFNIQCRSVTKIMDTEKWV